MPSRCAPTVRSDIPSLSEICFDDCPSATIASTATSVGVSEARSAPDGGSHAVPGRRGSLVMKWSDPPRRGVFGRNLSDIANDYMAFSPDERWVAGTSHGGVEVMDLNAPAGTKPRRLVENESAGLAVSPDAQTLATATAGELVLWNTATWEPRRRISTGLPAGVPVPVAFSPDGALLAVAATRREIALLDARTGEPLATLTPPLPLNLVTMRFSADGRHLAAQTLGPVIQVWDLRALRAELRALGLDW